MFAKLSFKSVAWFFKNYIFTNILFILIRKWIFVYRNKITAAVKAVGNFSVENLFQFFEQVK